MKHIVLVCAMGMSTSMMTRKMKQSAAASGLEVSVKAMPKTEFEASGEPVDVLLLGPQISYMLEEMKDKYAPRGVKVAVIDMMDYGMMNGEKVLKDALAL